LTIRARSGNGLVTPVEVSLWVMKTALTAEPRSSSAANRSGVTARPQGTSSRRTSSPNATATRANRSPKSPQTVASTGSPGDSKLTIATSQPAEPVPGQIKTSPSVRWTSRAIRNVSR
jgi:hypothetical protein